MKSTCNILILILFLSSCRPGSLSPVEYFRWIKNPENSLYREKEIDDYVFGLQYKPLDYVAILEQKNNDRIDKNLFETDKMKMSGVEQYTFTIKSKVKDSPLKNGISNEKEGFQRVNYFSYDIQNDLVLVEGKDTLKCAFCHFERTYEISPVLTFIVGFDKLKDKNETDRQFIYRDSELGTGTVKMIIKKSAIKRVPKIKIN